MTLRDFLGAYKPLFSTPQKDRFIIVKEKGTNKTIMNSYLTLVIQGIDWRRYNSEIYDRRVVTWAFQGNDTIIVCVDDN